MRWRDKRRAERMNTAAPMMNTDGHKRSRKNTGAEENFHSHFSILLIK